MPWKDKICTGVPKHPTETPSGTPVESKLL